MFTNREDIVGEYPSVFFVTLRRGSKHECWNLLVVSHCPLSAEKAGKKDGKFRMK